MENVRESLANAIVFCRLVQEYLKQPQIDHRSAAELGESAEQVEVQLEDCIKTVEQWIRERN